MSTINYCRLCVNIGLDFKNLYDENGQATEVYDLTVKYFQSILNTDDAKHLSMICLQCWEHIWDFNNFQLAVLVAQSNLDDIKHTEISPISSELPCANVLKDLQQQTSSAKVKIEDCEESEESAPPPPPPPTEDCDESEEIRFTVEFVKEEEELYDPASLFTGDEFGKLSDFTPQTNMEPIDSDIDIDSAIWQFSIRKPSINSSASKTNSKNPNHGNTKKYCRQANLMFVSKQLSIFFNHTQESCDEEFKKFAAHRSFICFICLEKCFGLKGLFIHSNRFHLSNPVQIICCKRRFKGLPSISKHLMSHYKSPILYPCEACGKTYSTQIFVNRHILKAHSPQIT